MARASRLHVHPQADSRRLPASYYPSTSRTSAKPTSKWCSRLPPVLLNQSSPAVRLPSPSCSKLLSTHPTLCSCPRGSDSFPTALRALPLSIQAASAALSATLEVREVDTNVEVQEVSRLRAANYYKDYYHEEVLRISQLRAENNFRDESWYHHYMASLKNHFAQQEERSIRTRLQERETVGRKFACLAAIDLGEGRVIGSADVRVPEAEEKLPEAYISNVCVDLSHRRLGVASTLLAKCFATAEEWNMSDVYAHVKADNQPALELYLKFGFEETYDSECGFAFPSSTDSQNSIKTETRLERTLLLRRVLAV